MSDAFWEEFLTATGRDAATRCADTYHFELTEEWADKLLELVLEGKKKATSSSLSAFTLSNDPLPKSGDLCVVTDGKGRPRCVVETTAVTVLPFRDNPWELCRKEGEDTTLTSWQEGHRRFFTREGDLMGYTFTEEMPIVFEEFRVVYTG